MIPRRLDDDRILAPKRAEGPDGLIGDALVEMTPEDPDYQLWDEYLTATGR